MDITKQIPGLAEAIEREQFARDVAFLGFPETVCGIELRPLTLIDVLRLRVVSSPFVVGGAVSALDVGAFFKLQCTDRSRFAKWCMLRSLARRVDLESANHGIQSFMDEAFADAPAGHRNAASYYSSAAAAIDCLGSEYGWPPDVTMSLPLKIVFQLYNAITARNNPATPLFNPSDRVRGDWLRAQN